MEAIQQQQQAAQQQVQMQQMQQQDEEREVDGIRNLKKTLKEDSFVDTNKEACVNASRELFSVVAAKYTSSANNCEECDGT